MERSQHRGVLIVKSHQCPSAVRPSDDRVLLDGEQARRGRCNRLESEVKKRIADVAAANHRRTVSSRIG